MGDKDNRVAALTDAVHVFVKFFTAFLGKCRGRLINDNNLRIEVGRLYDLDQLPVLEIVVVDNVCRLDTLEAVLFRKLRRLFIHGICIFNSPMYELIFVSQEYIFRYCKSRQGS